MTTTPYQLRQIGNSAVRNLVINGNFDFWQRGTSFATTNANPYCADRFMNSAAGAAFTITATRSTDVPTLAQSGWLSSYSLFQTNGTGSAPGTSDTCGILHRIEGFDFQNLHQRKVRIQFWVKSSVVGTFAVSLRNSAANRSYVTPLVVNVANAWEKKAFDITLDSSGTWLLDNTIGLRMEIIHTAGSTLCTSSTNQWLAGNFVGITGQTQWAATTGATFQLAQVMLIPGSFATGDLTIPFQRAGRTIQGELAMCQRYYEKLTGVNVSLSSNSGEVVSWGQAADGTTLTRLFFNSGMFKVNKRATPTMSFWAEDGVSNNVSVYNGSTTKIAISSVGNGPTEVGIGEFLTLSAAATAGVVYVFRWGADSEL